MYDVAQKEPSDDFKRAWQVAGRHLGPQGGDSFCWLRTDLSPPMAEHLSFRLGNQIFFVFVEAAEFVFEEASNLLLTVAREANAVPCIMPMTKRLTSYEPSLSGWGLIHAETKETLNPADFVSDESIEMTDWELHDFALQVVRSQLSEEGKTVLSAQSSLKIDPTLWYEEGGDAYWVVVRAVRHPAREARVPDNMADIAASCSRLGRTGFFASVLFADCDDPFDPEAATNGNFLPLYRGHAMSVQYAGLQEVEV